MGWSLDGAHDTSHMLTYDVEAGGERIRLAWQKCGDCGLEMLQRAAANDTACYRCGSANVNAMAN